MFNYKNYKIAQHITIVQQELPLYGVNIGDNSCSIRIGDQDIICDSIDEAIHHLNCGISELKGILLQRWRELSLLCSSIINATDTNTPSLDNVFFLTNLRKIYFFSRLYDDFDIVSNTIKSLFNVDITNISNESICLFNTLYLNIKAIHLLLETEIYKACLLDNLVNTKTAQSVSGPWSNLDLEMEERMWSGEDNDDEMTERTRARKNQTRYNPEYLDDDEDDKKRTYFKWDDYNRSPYKFDGSVDLDSPYPSLAIGRIP